MATKNGNEPTNATGVAVASEPAQPSTPAVEESISFNDDTDRILAGINAEQHVPEPEPEKPASDVGQHDDGDVPKPEGDGEQVVVSKAQWEKMMEAQERLLSGTPSEPEPKPTPAATPEPEKPAAATEPASVVEMTPLTDETFYGVLDNREAFEAREKQLGMSIVNAITRQLPQMNMAIIANQFPSLAASYQIMKDAPQFRKYPNIVMQAIQEVIKEHPDIDPITLEEETVKRLNATAAKVDRIKATETATPKRGPQFAGTRARTARPAATSQKSMSATEEALLGIATLANRRDQNEFK
jgi:hypothetical protein